MGLKKARCKLAQGRFQERIDAGTDKTLLVRRSAPPRAAKPLATIWTKELEARMLTRGITFERPGVFGAFCVLIDIDSTRLR